jgi:hypothetical protein
MRAGRLLIASLVFLAGFRASATDCYLSEYGVLYRVDLASLTVAVVGALDPAAPEITRAPDGLFWGRRGEIGFAALDPQSGAVAKSVRLPLRPYNHVIAGNGKAYICHNTLTSEGFWMSVVDTLAGLPLRPIKGIEGLRTGLAALDGQVYLATADVRSPGSLRLYAIDTATDAIREVLREPQDHHFWDLAGHDGLVYLLRIEPEGSPSSPSIELFDPARRELAGTVTAPDLDGVERLLGNARFAGNYGYLPCQKAGGGYAVAVFDTQRRKVIRMLPVSGRIYRIVWVDEERLLYTDNPMTAGKRGVSLFFYDIRGGKEAKRIELPMK